MLAGANAAFWKGVLVWFVVGALAMAVGRKSRVTAGDAWAAGLAAATICWAGELTTRWCLRPAQEGFSDSDPPAVPPPILDVSAPVALVTMAPAEPPAAADAGAPAAAAAGSGAPSFEDHFGRSHSGLFSGDLLQVSAPDPLTATQSVYLQRDLFSSELVMGPQNMMNLSKLRIVLPDHDPNRLRPIRYRQPVYVMHSAYSDNMNHSALFVKRSKTLVSHQTGESFREFILVNPAMPEDQREVLTHQPFCIQALASGGLPDAYLKVREDRRIDDSAGDRPQAATPFYANVRRPAEPGDRHLMVGPMEVLFP